MKSLIKLSRYLGSRFDLVQAGGGNTSFKEDNKLHVKSSGTYLGDMSLSQGVSTLDLDVLQKGISEIISSDFKCCTKKELELKGKKLLERAHIKGSKASIETFLHACFKKYVVHTHPIAVTHALSSRQYLHKVKSTFNDAYFCEYKTPGIELVLGIKDALLNDAKGPIVIFLENHGLVVSSDCPNEAINLTNKICDVIATWSNFNFSVYKESGQIFERLNVISEEDLMVLPIVSNFSKHFPKQSEGNHPITAFSPDIFIYLGFEIVNIDSDFETAVKKYQKSYGHLPSVISQKENFYVIANSYKKAKEIEDMFNCYVRIMSTSPAVKGLEDEELAYLAGWDAEKYRKEN